MVPTQELIKGRQSLLRVIFCTTPCKNVWTTTSPLFHLVQFLLNDGDSSGNAFSRTSFKLKKKRKENCGLLFTSLIKHETFQAVVGQQRPRTKKRDARANEVVVLLI